MSVRPELVVRFPLEGAVIVTVRAATAEDERRVRSWARAALESRGERLADDLLGWLDALDEHERQRAA